MDNHDTPRTETSLLTSLGDVSYDRLSAAIEQRIVDLKRRQSLADALAAAANLPVGVEAAVTVARLVERHGILAVLWSMFQADWEGADAAALLVEIGLDEVEVEAAMITIGDPR